LIRILHVITDLDVGGAEMMLLKLLTAMDRGGFENIVVSLRSPGKIGEAIACKGVQVRGLDMDRGLRAGLRGIAGLIRFVKRWKPDVVQTWLYHADLVGLLASICAGEGKVAWNIRCSNMDLRRYRKTTRMVVRLCAMLSSLPQAVITNSRAAIGYHRSLGYKQDRFLVIPNGFDTEKFRPDPSARNSLLLELGIPETARLVGHAARFDPMKDHGTFIEAARMTVGRNPEVHFLLAGEGVSTANPELLRWLEEGDIGGNVHLMGPRSDMCRFMAGLDIFCTSSCFGEGFPNVIGEAMACGCPCVVTDVGDSRAIVGNTGMVVPPGLPSLMAHALEKLISMPSRDLMRMGNAGREIIVSRYSIKKVTGDYEKLYRDLAGGRRICAA